MKEFIFFTDPHYYFNHSKSTIGLDGITSWLHTQLGVTKQVFDYARKYGIKDVIVGGDIFEEKDKISSLLYNTVWSTYNKLSKDFNIYFNIGNHDVFMVSGKTSLQPFSTIVNIISTKNIIDIDGCKVGFVPYNYTQSFNNPKYSVFTTEVDVCITHAIIENTFEGKKLHIDIPFSKLRDYPLVLNGHIHTYITVGNVVNVGSIMRQDFSEAGDPKYFLHYKEGKYTLVPVKCPDFFTYDYSPDVEEEIIKDNYNFYRLNVPPSKANLEIFKKFNVSRKLLEEVKAEVRLESFLTEEEEIIKYIEFSGTTLDKDRLIKTGLDLIGGV